MNVSMKLVRRSSPVLGGVTVVWWSSSGEGLGSGWGRAVFVCFAFLSQWCVGGVSGVSVQRSVVCLLPVVRSVAWACRSLSLRAWISGSAWVSMPSYSAGSPAWKPSLYLGVGK